MSPRYLTYLICGFCILFVYSMFTSASTLKAEADVQHVGYPLGATPSATSLCGPTFQVVDSPNASVDNNSLYDVVSLSEGNAWAVGMTEDVGGLIEHWDGVDWTIEPNGALGYLSTFYSVAAVATNDIWTVGASNNGALAYHWDGSQWSSFQVPMRYGTLYGVAALSANDVWAVGDYATNGVHAYAVHWNGSAWSEVPVPSVGAGASYLKDVAAISANDVWAVGYYYDPQPSRALLLHWDGTNWSATPGPDTDYTVIDGVDAVASNDVWAVGNAVNHTTGLYETRVIHWDGTYWSVVPSPPVASTYTLMTGVAHFSANDVWTVGQVSDPSFHITTLGLHWDGSAWTIVPTENGGSDRNWLLSVAAFRPNSAWAVGAYTNLGSQRTLIEQTADVCASATATGTGTPPTATVTRTPTPTSSGTPATLDLRASWDAYYYACDNLGFFLTTYVVPTGAAVPVTTTMRFNGVDFVVPPFTHSYTIQCSGYPCTRGAFYYTLVADYYNDVIETNETNNVDSRNYFFGPFCTPTPSRTPTISPSATSTTCPLQFSDVPAGSTFYPFIRCLACKGIINGYSSGCQSGNLCFRPNNNITRGQIAKIVSNAAGFSEPAGAQQFEDVPHDSTFNDFIWRLADRGYISGYPCGMPPAGPCNPPSNFPYFLPNNDVTRGQITKIVSNAVGFSDPPSGQQFEDIPPASTFYTFTFRLVIRSVMSGYPCGTPPAGPCNPPNNYSYFLPGNPATRGQSAKIIANTFFPDCSTPIQAKQASHATEDTMKTPNVAK